MEREIIETGPVTDVFDISKLEMPTNSVLRPFPFRARRAAASQSQHHLILPLFKQIKGGVSYSYTDDARQQNIVNFNHFFIDKYVSHLRLS